MLMLGLFFILYFGKSLFVRHKGKCKLRKQCDHLNVLRFDPVDLMETLSKKIALKTSLRISAR